MGQAPAVSAIVGLLHLDGAPAHVEQLAPALATLRPYGGDACRAWHSGSLVLGCQLRQYTPEPETYPLTRGHLALVADARLDARGDLGDALQVPPAARATLSDGELLLRAYERWGEGCAEHLTGDFAFALWDAHTRRLFLARDHIGARPLYYWHTEKQFAFATDLPALLAIPGVRSDVDEVQIAQLLLCVTPAFFANAHTFYRNVRKLPFGHTLTLGDNGLRLARHWFPERLPALRLPSPADYVDRLQTLLESAVADRLRTRLPVGAHLSGGLDSSAVAVLATRLRRQQGAAPPCIYSWSPPPVPGREDLAHLRTQAICAQERLTPLYAEATAADDQWAAEQDPSVRPINTLHTEPAIQRLAQAQGIGLILSGWGGDEGVSWNARGLAAQYLLGGEWQALAAYLELGTYWHRPHRLYRPLGNFYRRALLPLLPDAPYHWLRYPAQRPLRRECFILPEFAARIRPHLRPGHVPLREVPGSRASQIRFYLSGHLADRMESWAAHGADRGIVYAYPLTDRRVLEFACSIPPEMHYQAGQGRHLLRELTRRLFPPCDLWDRPKEDSAWVAHYKARQDSPLVARTRAALCVPNPWVDTVRLQRALGPFPIPIRARHALAALAIWRHHAPRS